MHTGNTAALLGARGGRRRAIFNPDGLVQFEAPRKAEELLVIFAQSIVELRAGRLEPKVAQAISSLGAGVIKAIEVAELDRRLAALEARHERQRK